MRPTARALAAGLATLLDGARAGLAAAPADSGGGGGGGNSGGATGGAGGNGGNGGSGGNDGSGHGGSGSGPQGPAAMFSTGTPVEPPQTPRAFICICGRPIFFRNSECLNCHRPLGYAPESGLLLPIEPLQSAESAGDAQAAGLWHQAGAPASVRWRRCANLNTAAACNWLLAETDTQPGGLCRCCRLTRTLPDLTLPDNPQRWNRIELAKRRLVSSLMGLNLPVASKMNEDPEHGLVFDLLQAQPGAKVITGHDEGVITLDVEEADDATREQRRNALGEPYRTLLGHLRHESGHYYWDRLVDHTEWLQPYRELFGDETQDYTEALKRHYTVGARPDWGQNFVSAYASSHPWEDWAETWAHYLHLVDTLDTARSFGLDGENVELNYERYGKDAIDAGEGSAGDDFLKLINGWMELTGVLNELSRSMGVPDFYPFVLSKPAVRKLNFIHRVITAPRPAG